MRIILALGGVLLLAGCATTSPSSTVPIDLPALPASIAGACDRPVALPTADTGRQDVERYWARDRTALAKCAARHAGTVSYYETLQRNLAGGK